MTDTATLNADLAAGLALMVVGMLLVLGALTALALTIALLQRLFKAQGGAPMPAPSAAAPALPPEQVAVIAAAASALLKRPVRICRVDLAAPPVNLWAVEGRLAIMASHHPQRHRRSS